MQYRRKLPALGATLLICAFIVFCYRSSLIGWWRGEAKYKGRYTNSWRAEMRSYHFIGAANLGTVDYDFFRPPTKLETWLAKLIPNTSQISPAPLQDGDPEALVVLIELLDAPEPIVRIMAAAGLGEMGSPAREAIPALLTLTNDEDGEVAMAARQAIRFINSNTNRGKKESKPSLRLDLPPDA